MKNYYLLILIIPVLILGYFLFKNSQTTTRTDPYATNPQASSSAPSMLKSATPMDTKTYQKPEMTIDTKKTYSAVLHTAEGDITILFDTKNTPVTANNFISLAKSKFYDNTIFHRAVEGFMIQGGDPQGTGAGGPGYKFEDEYLRGEYTRGTVAMANAGPDTNGSQFFIMHKDYPLPNDYVIFGKVTSGIEVVDKIATAETTYSFGGEKSKPVNPVKITSVDILEK